jgi:acyl-CoA thioesterase
VTDGRFEDRQSDLPQAVAERAAQALWAGDLASRGLGMSLLAVGPDYCRISMQVRGDMLNGFGICHGGFITTLADSAFAFACNSRDELTLAAGLVVDFVAPAHAGDLLQAEARQVAQAGRTGVYDIAVTNQHGDTVVLVRGRSHRIPGKSVTSRGSAGSGA